MEANYVHGLFSIDPATGQLMTKTSLNYEPNNQYYAVMVNVADSSLGSCHSPLSP